jgi:probable pyridine nucleotide-disulfide oxidoreductase
MNHPEPYDAVVIGGGKGGKTLAMHLARQNRKTALIERDPLMIGGGCINVACIPTKTFIASARLVHSMRRAAEYGIRVGEVAIDWPAVRKRVEGVVSEMRALNLKTSPRFRASILSWAPAVFSGRNASKWCRTKAGSVS